VAVFVFGLLLTAILMVRKVKGAILISILSSTVLAFIVEAIAHPAWHLADRMNPHQSRCLYTGNNLGFVKTA
jgi:xanthine/uracil/vitamin C permease (AzgA family)